MGGRSFNGKTGELMRWVIGLAVAVLVSYFTAQNATNERLTTVETTERLHYEANQRDLHDIKASLLRQEDRWQRVLDDYRNGIDSRTGERLLLQRSIEEPSR